MNFLFENIQEIVFLNKSDLSFKVGGFIEDSKIIKLNPIKNPDAALIAIEIIVEDDRIFGTIPLYGVMCLIKTGVMHKNLRL